MKFDKDLGHYELVYPCGYSSVVCLADISSVMENHQFWAESTNLKIIEMVNDAEQDWNNFKGIYGSSDAERGVLVPIGISENGVANTDGSDSNAIDGRIVISETTNSSGSPRGNEVAVEGNSNPEAIVGHVIFTSWTLEMNRLSRANVPSKWREDMNAV